MKTVLGRIRDIEPSGARPRLELHFSPADSACLPDHHKDAITIRINGQSWTGTIGLKPGNDPYVHTYLNNGTSKRSCTDLLLALDLAEGAVLQFLVRERDVLELAAISSRGSWRPGGHPDQRAARTTSPRRRSSTRPHAERQEAPKVAGESFPFGDREAIVRLATLYWSKIRASEQAEERAFEAAMPEHRRHGELDKGMFVRLARWKSVRKTPDYDANSDEEVRQATREAFAADAEADAIRALCRLRGVALRTATALLHWMAPDRYPILDFRVLSALGEPPPTSFESPALYVRIADRVRHHASALRVDLRTLDRALWTWDKVRSS